MINLNKQEIKNQLINQLSIQVWNQVRIQLRYQLINQLSIQVWNQVRIQVHDQLNHVHITILDHIRDPR